ncbi:hypothetical protein LTR86_011198 [Recurvomyces mirabilis]|nr:hypothetical protein LTR86_011198 [Recurvomyces mirabilis]
MIFLRDSAHPVLLLDIGVNSGPAPHKAQAFRPLPAQSAEVAANVRLQLIRDVLIPFPDVVCIFADDFGGLNEVIQFIRSCDEGPGPRASENNHTRFIVVASPADGSSITYLDEADFLDNARKLERVQMLGSVSVERVPGGESNMPRYLALRRRLYDRELDGARAERFISMKLFCGTHLASMVSQCMEYTVSNPAAEFDVFLASRRGVITLTNLGDCLVAVLHSLQGPPHGALVTVIATSLLMDAYPRGSHHFTPQLTFRKLYRTQLFKCLDEYFKRDSSTSISHAHCVLRYQTVNHVQREFVRGWGVMRRDRTTALALHKTRIQQATIRDLWSCTHSNVLCSIYLLRRPEHILKCRHTLCDFCVKRFGTLRPSEEYVFVFDNCLVCGKEATLLVRLKPPTADIRIISVDGGGIRAIVPLELLSQLSPVSYDPDRTLFAARESAANSLSPIR